MQLHGFSRSSAAFRVRIALGLKGLAYENVSVSLPAGEQFADAYRAVNPQARVPTLVDGDRVLFQSMAIMDYLEDCYPEPSFLPGDVEGRARVRGLANIIACDIHPLNNLAVLKFLAEELNLEKNAVNVTWYHHWIHEGLHALEAHLSRDRETGIFCHGDSPGLADICLVPQVFNAQRYKCDLSSYPVIARIFDACMGLEAFDRAQPARQPDA